MRILIYLLVALAVPAAALPDTDAPLGLVLAPGGATLTRSGAPSASAARPGDLIYSGDRLQAGSAPVAFLYCPGKRSLSFRASSDIQIFADRIRIAAGEVEGQREVPSCFLPETTRLAAASRQKYGTFQVRGEEDSPVRPTPRSQWSAELAADLEPLDKAPSDPAVLLVRAAIFEKHAFRNDALLDYRTAAKLWPDLEWLANKVIELTRARATQPGQTFSVIN